MKAERRHELQHNELADWLAEAIERIKPYSRAIVGVAVAAAVLLVTYVVLSGRAERKQSAAWTEFYLATQAASKEEVESDLETVVNEHQGVAAGLWAEVALADLQLGQGIDSLFRDKLAADKKLKSAVNHYETVIDEAEDSLLVARARFGLARAKESLGRLDEAREIYEEIVKSSGTNAYVSPAKSRLADLKRSSTQDFYAWFAKQEPVSAPDSSLPGTPGEKMPFDLNSFGTLGDLNLSSDGPLSIPPLDTGTTGPLLTPEPKEGEGKVKADDKAKADDIDAKENVDSDGKPSATESAPEARKDEAGKDEAGAPADTDKASEELKPTDESVPEADAKKDGTTPDNESQSDAK